METWKPVSKSFLLICALIDEIIETFSPAAINISEIMWTVVVLPSVPVTPMTVSFFEGKDIVMVSGGCGIPPIAALVEYIIRHREKFGRVYLLYGAATPQDILAQGRLDIWGRHINILLTVDRPAPGWKGHVGLVSEMVKDIEINPLNAVATMCGPGPMMTALERILRPLGISDRRIYVSLERKMQCGIGKCQHCTTGDSYVCLDGPVYTFDAIDKNWD